MFDPLSALACIGFSIGALSFLANTVSKIDERAEEMRECKSRLRSFHWRLQELYLKFAAWQTIWLGKKPFRDETYIDFWGSKTFEDIHIVMGEILKVSKQIERLLRMTSCLDKEQSNAWVHLLNLDPFRLAEARPMEVEKIKLMQKIGFTLFRNESLLEKIARLRSQIDGLENISQLSYRMRQHKDPNTKVTHEELLNASKIKIFIDDVSRYACSLYTLQQSEEQHIRWALELSPPEVEQALDPWNEPDTTYLDFFIRNIGQAHQRKAKRFRVFVLGDLGDIQTTSIKTFSKIHEILRDEVDTVLEDGPELFNLLEEPKSRSKPFRKMLTEGILSGPNRKSFDVERAELAYGLAHWFVMLWNTPWSWNLCSCGIRCTRLVKSSTRHAFDPRIGGPHWAPECHPANFANRRLLLLGITLAEIALTVPISVKPDGHSLMFTMGERWITGRSLADKIRKQCGRDTITKAVRYCLEYEDRKPESTLRPEDFEDYRQNILLP